MDSTIDRCKPEARIGRGGVRNSITTMLCAAVRQATLCMSDFFFRSDIAWRLALDTLDRVEGSRSRTNESK